MPAAPPAIDAERLRRRAAELVRVPSLTGAETEAVELFTRWLRETGAEVDRWTDAMAELERDPEYPGREVEREQVPVVAARVRGTGPGPTVLLTGHLDVVPTGDRRHWEVDPFSAHVDGDRLYGRGACDMKAGLVAALEVFDAFARTRDFPGEVVLVAVPGEEDGGTGTLSAIRRGWRGDYAIITEPTGVQGGEPGLIVAHGGALTFTIRVEGRNAHASKRREGENALDHCAAVLEALRADERRLNEGETDPCMRALGLPYPISVGRVSGGDWAASVMDWLELEVRVGVALGESVRAAEERFRSAILEGTRADPWLAAHPPEVTRSGAVYASARTPAGTPLADALGAAAQRVFGSEPRRGGAPYGCDMAAWIRVAGTPTVVYGPGDVRLAHAPNEWVSLAEAERVAQVVLRATRALLEGG